MDEDLGPLNEAQASELESVDTVVRLAPSQTITVQFDADELRALAAEARRANVTVSALVRRAALESIRSVSFGHSQK